MSSEKFTIEVDVSKVSNTLLELRVDAKTKALWQYKLSLAEKRIIKQAVIDLVRKFAESEIPEPKGNINNVYININATPSPEEKQSDELLTKELDVTKRKLRLCEEEVDTLKKENKKVKECEDKLKEYEKKLKEIEKQIALYKQGTVTDLKQVINYIIKVLSQA